MVRYPVGYRAGAGAFTIDEQLARPGSWIRITVHADPDPNPGDKNRPREEKIDKKKYKETVRFLIVFNDCSVLAFKGKN